MRVVQRTSALNEATAHHKAAAVNNESIAPAEPKSAWSGVPTSTARTASTELLMGLIIDTYLIQPGMMFSGTSAVEKNMSGRVMRLQINSSGSSRCGEMAKP